MPLSISFELSDQDLEHFVAAQRGATEAAANKSQEEIIRAGEELLKQAQATPVPDFISQRLTKLDNLIAMVRDEGWSLSEEDRKRVLAALVYFADPADVIPDSVPVLGYLDDAIMIELCVRDLKHEIDAYDDFCDFRESEARRLGLDPATVGSADWLESRRVELQNRMHQRRERDFGAGYGASSGYASRRNYAASSWRPSIFRVR
ncbi:MAG: YkvA family protein [Lysobacteraceae bacterium]|uniref:YkvA family protein n=1 Tax=Denitratimonas sp. CY0512 TaxID=3131940 RepID=UPI0030A73E7E